MRFDLPRITISDPLFEDPTVTTMDDKIMSKLPIYLNYDNRVYTITQEYYDLVLEYTFYDCLKKSRTIHHFNKIDTLTADEFKSRYTYNNERKYRSAITRYESFRTKNTFVLNQPAISSPLDKLIPKPSFTFTQSLLELDHWCQCVIYPCIKDALAVLGITIDLSSPKGLESSLKALDTLEKTILEEIEIREIQQTAFLNPMDDDDESSNGNRAATNLHVPGPKTTSQRYSYIVASALSPNQKKKPIYKSKTEINPEAIFLEGDDQNSTLQEMFQDDSHLEAFCRIVQDGIDNLEPTTNFIVNLSARHAFIKTFQQCKEDLINAVIKCIPENVPSSPVYPVPPPQQPSETNVNVNSSFRQRSPSIASALSAMLTQSNSASSGTVFGDSEDPDLSDSDDEESKLIHVHNEFEALLNPSCQTSLSKFFDTFETCRRRMLHNNNPLHPTNYYLVDAGYISDPRRRCRLTDPKKATLRETMEFHKRLLKKEAELGYHKYLWSAGDIEGNVTGFFNGTIDVQQFKGICSEIGIIPGRPRQSFVTSTAGNTTQPLESVPEKVSDTLSNENGKTSRESMGLDELINDTLACLDSDFDFDYVLNYDVTKDKQPVSTVPKTLDPLELKRRSDVLDSTYEAMVGRTLSMGSSTLLERNTTLKTMSNLSALGTVVQMSTAAQEERCYSRYYSMLAYTVRVHYFSYNRVECTSRNLYQYDDEYAEVAMEIVVLIEAYMNGFLGELEELEGQNEGDAQNDNSSLGSRVVQASKSTNKRKVKRKPVDEKVKTVDYSEARREQVDALIDRKVNECNQRVHNSWKMRKLQELLDSKLGNHTIMTRNGTYYPLVPGYQTYMGPDGQVEYGLYGKVNYDGDQERRSRRDIPQQIGAYSCLSDIPVTLGSGLAEIGTGINGLAKKVKNKGKKDWKLPYTFVKDWNRPGKNYSNRYEDLTDLKPPLTDLVISRPLHHAPEIEVRIPKTVNGYGHINTHHNSMTLSMYNSGYHGSREQMGF